MSRRLLVIILIVSAALPLVLGIASNVASETLPDTLRDPRLVWGVVVIGGLVTVTCTVLLFLHGQHDPTVRVVIHEDEPGDPGHAHPDVPLVHTHEHAHALEYVDPEATPVPVPAELPPSPADFTGRDGEVAELADALTGPRARTLVAIDGQGGIGKSALALHVAHRLRHHFPDGQLYVDLRGAAAPGAAPLDPLVVLGQFLRVLGVPASQVPTDLDTAAALYRSRVAGRRMLVVLDNAAGADQVRPLLPGDPRCRALVTSRRYLPELEGAVSLSLGLLPESDAVELLAKLAGRERVDADRPAARELARRCGRLPLAVRIAGARLRARPGWTVRDLLVRLEREAQPLAELTAGELSVRTCFRFSYEELPEEHRQVFRLLGLLPVHQVTPGLAAALADRSVHQAEAVLEALVDAQMLTCDQPGRYWLHDLMHRYARHRAEAEETPADRAAAVRRAYDWYLGLARHAGELIQPHQPGAATDSPFPDRDAAWAWLEAERGQLAYVVEQAAEAGDPAAWQLPAALFPYLALAGLYTDWYRFNETALRAARQAGDRWAEASVLNDLGVVYLEQRRLEEAVTRFRESLAIRREIGDRRGEAQTLNNLGVAYREQGWFDEAIDCGQASRSLSWQARDRHGIARALNNIGLAHLEQVRYAEAFEHLEQSLRLYTEIGDRHGQGKVLNNIGLALLRQRKFPEAHDYLRRSLAIRREVGDRRGEAQTLNNLGLVYLWQRIRFDEAIRCFERSLEIRAVISDRYGQANCLRDLGCALEATHDLAGARACWERSLALFSALRADHRADEVRSLLDRAVTV